MSSKSAGRNMASCDDKTELVTFRGAFVPGQPAATFSVNLPRQSQRQRLFCLWLIQPSTQRQCASAEPRASQPQDLSFSLHPASQHVSVTHQTSVRQTKQVHSSSYTSTPSPLTPPLSCITHTHTHTLSRATSRRPSYRCTSTSNSANRVRSF
jgi:hypothetical protein